MNEEKIPLAIHSGTFNLLGVDLKCHVLDDGKTIIEAESMGKFFDAMAGNAEKMDNEELTRFVAFLKGVRT